MSFANCGLPYYVSDEITDESALLLQTPRSLASSLNLDVRILHSVTGLDPAAKTVTVSTPDGMQTMEYDTLILSPGALPSQAPIPGLDNPRVYTLRTVDDAKALKILAGQAKTAVVLGAGFIGLEAAEALAHRGLKVTVVEFAPHVLPPLEKELAWLVAEEMRRLGMDVREATAATGIADGQDDSGNAQAIVSLSDGTAVGADMVVMAVGGRPDTSVFEQAGLACERGFVVVDEHGRTNLDHVYAVGDATLSTDAVTSVRRPVPLAGPANRAGRYVSDVIATGERARPIPRPLGTAIVRVGKLTAAMTGANRDSLNKAERTYTTIHTHPGSHAGYFPGSTQMHLMVHIDPATGEILGAQGVGQDGVDKRIDVLATAIRAGLTAADLIDLDLCYSPPYGSAKDPVTMVGFVADNIMTGQTRLWHPEQLDWARSQDVCLIDVRSAQEFATGHLPEATNIPHVQMRDRMDEVKALVGGRPVALMCQSGVRSYIAHRIMTAAGYDSATLSGGMLTLRAWLGADAEKILV